MRVLSELGLTLSGWSLKIRGQATPEPKALSALARRMSDTFFRGLHQAERDHGAEFAVDIAEGQLDGASRYLDGETLQLPEDETEYADALATAVLNTSNPN